jgi:ribosomal protein S18 acetylase RimI-like enzyme
MHRILVIANETADTDRLHEVVRAAARRPNAAVLVVAPALNGRLRHWLSDTDAAREAARRRLVRSVAALAAVGVEAEGMIGDSDPLQAAIDALHLFPAGEIVIATHPESRSNWLARRLVDRLAERFDGPIKHVVVEVQDPPTRTSVPRSYVVSQAAPSA